MIDLEKMNSLGNTALGMAYIRCKESLRGDNLFYDKLAVEVFKVKKDKANAEISTDDSYIIVRTKFFDETISRILKKTDIEQIIVLGIGLDIRFQRLDLSQNFNIFEIDQPEVIKVREKYIPKLDIKSSNIFVRIGHIFSNEKSLSKALAENGFDKTKKSLWILEGLLYYLHKSEVEILLSELSDLSTSESKILCDGINSTFLESNFTQPWIKRMREEGRGWYFGIDNYEEFFKRFGWEIELTQPGEANANYGRWKHKVFPLSLKGIPRYFFIEGSSQ